MSAAPAPPPPAAKPPPPPRAAPTEASSKTFTIGKSIRVGKRIGIYGPGGCGKTSLAKALTTLGKRVVWLDVEKSADDFGVEAVPEIGPDSEWSDVRAALKAPIWTGVDAIVIDSVTKLEEMCMAHVFATVPKAEGSNSKEYTDTLEGYGYGKGYGHLYNKFTPIFQDLEKHSLAGRHIIMICHDIIGEAKNPEGENYERMEPRLMNSPKYSIRNRFREWLTDLWAIKYDVNVNKDTGKAKGGGTRAIYTTELPTYWAKSRTLDRSYVFAKGDDQQIWKDLFAKE